VCEGCGDCSVQSNCISIEPVETPLGRKRRIHQSSCNKDYSCLKGYCPSFVSVEGARLRKASTEGADTGGGAVFAGLPDPALPACDRPWNVLVAGIGGTGVVTIGALLAMAAHLEGKGCSELDVTGLAQKNGPVSSHVRIASDPEAIHATRIAVAGADLVIGCDPVVTTGIENLPRMAPGRSRAVMNRHVAPTSDFASQPDLDLSPDAMEEAVRAATGGEAVFLDATELATALLGDAIYTNPLLLGFAWQKGWLPVGEPALLRAVELNGREVETNKRAFAWGRLLAHDPERVEAAARPLRRTDAGLARRDDLESLRAHRMAHLEAYQGPSLARRYAARLDRVVEREKAVRPGQDALARAVAHAYAKLLAYKDEYEVARLYTDGSLQRQLAREFEGDLRLRIHLSPQFLPRWIAPRDPETGRVRKWAIPAGLVLPAFRAMAKLRVLRGTPFDPFGWTAHRRLERRLVGEYEAVLDELLAGLTPENHDLAVEIASLPEHVRGFDDVKEASLAEVRAKQEELLRAFRLRAPAAAVTALGSGR
jgi:indolepyruvate ferredoxin oxidoreductase